jgi:hypothetical protein
MFKVGLFLLGLLNTVYGRIRRNEIKKAKVMIKKIRIDMIFDSITRNCWKSGIQYETLMKNAEILDIKLKGRKEVVLIRFHKADMIFIEDYERFIIEMEVHGVKRGTYITTGVFEGKIIKINSKVYSLSRQVKVIDFFDFIKSQLGLYGIASEVFKSKKLRFYKYFPS